jgi:hypothetical protein
MHFKPQIRRQVILSSNLSWLLLMGRYAPVYVFNHLRFLTMTKKARETSVFTNLRLHTSKFFFPSHFRVFFY